MYIHTLCIHRTKIGCMLDYNKFKKAKTFQNTVSYLSDVRLGRYNKCWGKYHTWKFLKYLQQLQFRDQKQNYNFGMSAKKRI